MWTLYLLTVFFLIFIRLNDGTKIYIYFSSFSPLVHHVGLSGSVSHGAAASACHPVGALVLWRDCHSLHADAERVQTADCAAGWVQRRLARPLQLQRFYNRSGEWFGRSCLSLKYSLRQSSLAPHLRLDFFFEGLGLTSRGHLNFYLKMLNP